MAIPFLRRFADTQIRAWINRLIGEALNIP